jgi:hypothetical protein
VAISRGDVAISMAVVERGVETEDGRPLAFKVVQALGQMATTIDGRIGADGMVKVTTTSGGGTSTRDMDWPKGALLAEGLRLLSLRRGLQEGTAYFARGFDGSSLTAVEANITVGGKEDMDLFGRVVRLTKITTEMFAPAGRIVITTHVNDKQDALKTVASIMGMDMEMIACDKEFALSPNDVVDFLDRFLLPSPAPLKDVKTLKEVRYTLQVTGKESLKFVTTDEQVVQPGEGNVVVLTVRPLAAVPGDKFPYAGADAALRAALKPTPILQCDDARVAALAKEAVAGAKDSAEAVRKIEGFVGKYIRKKDLSVGYASAAEVAQSRQGDCTEHAVLAAAMCRSAGIPAQVVVGLAYAPAFGGKRNVFGPHAWARANVGGKWVSLDAALDGFDAGHIALGCGDGEAVDFFGAVNLLGNFKIVEVKPVPGR